MADDLQARIRELAFHMWEAAGRQQNMATEYWLAAERQVKATIEAGSEKIMPARGEKALPTTNVPKGEAESEALTASTPTIEPTAKKTGYKIEQIEGIGPAYAVKLATVGIKTTGDLLDRCGNAEGRETAMKKTGLSSGQLLKWASMADLMRVSGIGGEYAELLEAAGVDTIKELRSRSPETLAAKMAEVNGEKKLTRRVASAKQVAKWVEQAKTLDPLITN